MYRSMSDSVYISIYLNLFLSTSVSISVSVSIFYSCIYISISVYLCLYLLLVCSGCLCDFRARGAALLPADADGGAKKQLPPGSSWNSNGLRSIWGFGALAGSCKWSWDSFSGLWRSILD